MHMHRATYKRNNSLNVHNCLGGSAVLFWWQSHEKGGYTSQFEVLPATILGYFE